MRAPIIPGRKSDDDQREVMLRRLGIAEEKPPVMPSRWDVLARELLPVAPVQTQPPINAAPEPAPLPPRQPVPMVEAQHDEQAAPAPQARVPDASFMPGWGEESIPEDEDVEAEAVDDVEPRPPVHEARWLDQPLAEAPRREELLQKMERPVGYPLQPAPGSVANDQTFDIPEPRADAPALPPARDAAPIASSLVAFNLVRPPAAPEPVIQRAPAPEPEPAPPVDAALQQMRAELEAMRKQFQTAPAAPIGAAPLAAAIPYDDRRRSRQRTDFFANARMVVWTLAIVAALWVSFHGMKAAQAHHAKQDHIMATVTGAEAADQPADQNSDN